MRLVAARVGHILTVGLGLTSAANAEPARTTAALSWVRGPGAETCPTLAEVTAAVDGRLKRSAFVGAREAEALIEATIFRSAENGDFRVHISISDRASAPLGTRDLQAPGDDCRAITDTAALAIALMIDPEAGSADERDFAMPLPVAAPSPAQPASAPAHEPEAPAAPCAPLPRAPEPPPPRETKWRTRLGLSGLAIAGQLPGIAPGVLASVRLMPPSSRVGLEVLGRYLAEKSEEARPGAGGSFDASSIGAAVSWSVLPRERWALSLDAAAEVGRLYARGYNFSVANRYSREWLVNAGVGSELAFHVAEPWSLVLHLGLKLPLVRSEFRARAESESSTIFETSALLGEASLGVAWAP